MAKIIDLAENVLYRNQLKKNEREMQQKQNEEKVKKQILQEKKRQMMNKKKIDDANEILSLFYGSGRRF